MLDELPIVHVNPEDLPRLVSDPGTSPIRTFALRLILAVVVLSYVAEQGMFLVARYMRP
jgi:hypothetical protein